MADYIKYFTSTTFDRNDFAAMLKEKMNVQARAVDDGVIIDRGAFNCIHPAHMPHWAFINREDINSALHTRAATEREIFMLSHHSRFFLKYRVGRYWRTALEGDDLEELKACADVITAADKILIISSGNIIEYSRRGH